MLSVDLRNAFENSRADNFTVLLLRLIAKADSENAERLSGAYPEEVTAVDIYKNHCIYRKTATGKEPDWDAIADEAKESCDDEEFDVANPYDEGR